ncbi:MAG TPA: M20/M25/M40 family metallo-hydrolase [Bacteroidota bacterium]|nr:M20/M25/M40 family metallo-hydrolase [Bacteroidota bacterium]
MPSPLVDLFLEAVKIDAVSLHEGPVVRFLREKLDGLPVQIVEDGTAALVGGQSGNVICVPPSFDPSRPAYALLAHMDTPRSTANVRPVLNDFRITSDGTTVLGVDNRAGFSVLLHVLTEHIRAGRRGNFIVVFTIAEEIGMYGSKNVDLLPYNVKTCFVFDCSKRPGTFIRSAVGSSLYSATFHGKSSHAGVAPEKGVNAIQIAARALSDIPMGRLTPTMTSNVGMITGGEATNVVPDSCKVHGEVREFSQRLIDEHLAMLQVRFAGVARDLGGSLTFESQVDFPPFELDGASEAYCAVVEILRSVGLAPNPIEYLGGSDANMLNAKGIPAINLGIGAQNPHGNDEFILLEDMSKSEEIAREIIARSVS